MKEVRKVTEESPRGFSDRSSSTRLTKEAIIGK